MDEPTAALGVKESRRVLELILDVKKRGLPIILISHNMPHVFEVADRIHIHRLGPAPDGRRSEEGDDVGRGGDDDRRHGAAGRSGGGLRLASPRLSTAGRLARRCVTKTRVARFMRARLSSNVRQRRARRPSCGDFHNGD